jgi:hypothetical protein
LTIQVRERRSRCSLFPAASCRVLIISTSCVDTARWHQWWRLAIIVAVGLVSWWWRWWWQRRRRRWRWWWWDRLRCTTRIVLALRRGRGEALASGHQGEGTRGNYGRGVLLPGFDRRQSVAVSPAVRGPLVLRGSVHGGGERGRDGCDAARAERVPIRGDPRCAGRRQRGPR